jgi:hypothetical protein
MDVKMSKAMEFHTIALLFDEAASEFVLTHGKPFGRTLSETF